MAQTSTHQPRLTPAEYLALERGSEQKHEYLRGLVFAMAGASPKHNLACANIAGALRDRLRALPCVVLPSDQHVYVEATDLGTYPDVVVFCGPAKYHREFAQSLVNPSVLIEVLSPSTEAYDRGTKFEHYRQLETLREYVLVATESVAVDHYLREADGTWRLSTPRGPEGVVRFSSLDVVVPLAEIYEKIDLVAPEGLEEASPRPPAVTTKK
jgi:Uma2 family endonuclease